MQQVYKKIGKRELVGYNVIVYTKEQYIVPVSFHCIKSKSSQQTCLAYTGKLWNKWWD